MYVGQRNLQYLVPLLLERMDDRNRLRRVVPVGQEPPLLLFLNVAQPRQVPLVILRAERIGGGLPVA